MGEDAKDDTLYPCATEGCEVMRSKNEGGTVFTVCDKHRRDFWRSVDTVPEPPKSMGAA